MADHIGPQGGVPAEVRQRLGKGRPDRFQIPAVHQLHRGGHLHRRLHGGNHPGVGPHGPLPVHDGLCLVHDALGGGLPVQPHRHDVHGAVSPGQGQHLHPQNVLHLDAPGGIVVGVAGGGGGGQRRQGTFPQLVVRLPLPAVHAPVGADGGEPVPFSRGHEGPALQAVDVHAPELSHSVGAGPEHVPGEGALLRAAGAGVSGRQQPQQFFFRHPIKTSVVWVNFS